MFLKKWKRNSLITKKNGNSTPNFKANTTHDQTHTHTQDRDIKKQIDTTGKEIDNR